MNIPKNYFRYKQMPIWNNQNISSAILGIHNTRAGVYGKIQLLKGELEYNIYDDNDKIIETKILSKGNFGVALPQQKHSIKPIGDIEMFLDFYQQKPDYLREKENNFIEKYDKFPHFEVVKLLDIVENINDKKVVDFGSGGGRNSLFLSENGAKKVFCFDKNREFLLHIKNIAENNNLNLETQEVDFHNFDLKINCDIAICTVVLQFLEKQSAINLISQMQNLTNDGGYNLIIAPIESHDIPSILNFPGFFEENEIKKLYTNWDILHYDEMIGEFHKTDKDGNRIRSRFSTILAKK